MTVDELRELVAEREKLQHKLVELEAEIEVEVCQLIVDKKFTKTSLATTLDIPEEAIYVMLSKRILRKPSKPTNQQVRAIERKAKDIIISGVEAKIPYRDISENLNSQGFRTLTGKEWTQQNVRAFYYRFLK